MVLVKWSIPFEKGQMGIANTHYNKEFIRTFCYDCDIILKPNDIYYYPLDDEDNILLIINDNEIILCEKCIFKRNNGDNNEKEEKKR